MAERKKVNVPGFGIVEGTDVPLIESVERRTELRLEDGSILRIKPVVMSILRIDGQYDAQGDPMYAINAGQTMTVAHAPEHLRRPGQDPRPKVQ
jgi:hypothetical protein